MSLTFPTTVQYKRRQRPALEVGTLGRSRVYLVQMPPSLLRLVYKEGRRIEGLGGSSYDKVKWDSGPNEGKKVAIRTLEAWAQNAESGGHAGSQDAARYRDQITNITGKTAMSNPDDFWTKLATGHTNTVLAHGMDRHLGAPLGDSFEGVRVLSDVGRAAHALSLPVAAGVKVSFAGTLGALMAHDDSPADGAIGEVVTVKSATGEITHHDGKVFVKWDDGKFRPIHSEHLRLAGSTSKTASKVVKIRKDDKGNGLWIEARGKLEGPLTAAQVLSKVDSYLDDSDVVVMGRDHSLGRNQTAVPYSKALYVIRNKRGDVIDEGYSLKNLWNKWFDRFLGWRMASQDKEVAELLKAKPDNEFLQSVEEQLDDDRSLSDKQEEVLDEIQDEVKSDKAASFRVGTLGDLTNFLKVAEGKLIHTSTADLWSYTKDADGAFLVSRLFDDMGEPLKG